MRNKGGGFQKRDFLNISFGVDVHLEICGVETSKPSPFDETPSIQALTMLTP